VLINQKFTFADQRPAGKLMMHELMRAFG